MNFSGTGGAEPGSDSRAPTGYAFYALSVLVVVTFLNYADRSIFGILAENIKSDLHLQDSQLGFLFGTAFAVLFALVGIPIGRVSDRVRRTTLLACGLTVWAAMTAASALASTFLLLAIVRVGVGFGEACANPCSHSLVSDYFPRRWRATALAICLMGTYVGTGGALLIGGYILEKWPFACQALGACGFRPWQAAFLIMGLPGLMMAILVANLREPARPAVAGPPLPRFLFDELTACTPPFTLIAAARLGWGPFRRNAILLGAVAASAAALAALTGDHLQWTSVGLGAYGVGSWIQGIERRDRPFFVLSFGCPIFTLGLIGMAGVGIIGGTFDFWVAPYAIRVLHMTPREAGSWIGPLMMTGSVIGVLSGGLITDAWKRNDVRAPLFVPMISLVCTAPVTATMFTVHDKPLFLACVLCNKIVLAFWGGAAAAFVQDMVLPRMRGTASACYSLLIILITLSVGPYAAGKISNLSGSLGVGVISMLALVPPSLMILWFAARRIQREDVGGRMERAALAGEAVAIKTL